jgi:7-cyano-7-deazaguanine synthase in queuosine biosynthesis
MKKQKPHQFSASVYFAISGGLLLLVAAILLATQGTPAVSAPVTSQEEESYPEISRVYLDDAKSALDGGTAIIVDVRSAEAYQASHIAVGVNIPVAELETRLGELDKTQ